MSDVRPDLQPDAPTPRISPEVVRHVAKLSRLALTDDEHVRLAGQMELILDYVAQVDRVDVSNVEPTAHAVPLSNVMRDDEPGPTLPLEQVLQNAPATDGPFFKVPKVLGAPDDSAG